ncbi:MAG: hypothetical protein ABII00_03945 [Elusimicrobiota bacterium]
MIANPDQADNDGVADGSDECLGTEAGTAVNAVGCSIAQLCPSTQNWKNHGKCVSCVAHAAKDMVEAGRSDIGKKIKKGKK